MYVNGALYAPGEVCAAIEVVDGIAQTDARALPLWLLPNGGKQSLGRATSTRTRPCALSRFGKMGRSSSSGMATLPTTKVVRGDLQFIKVGEGGEGKYGQVRQRGL